MVARYRPNVDYTSATAGTDDGHVVFTPNVNATFTAPAGGLEVTGTVAAGAADSGNPVKVGGVYNSTKPTLANGQRGDLQLGTRGSTIVQFALPDSVSAVTTQAAGADAVSNTFNAYFGSSFGYVFNGTTWDRAAGNTAGAFAQGNVAAAVADAGNPVKVGGVYSLTLPTLTTGQRGNWQLTAKGAGIVTPYTAAGAEIPFPATLGRKSAALSLATVPAGMPYETVAASQTDQVLGGAGAAGDYLSHIVIQPVTTGAGAVTVKDGATTIFLFTAGTLADLSPKTVPFGIFSAGALSVTTGANVTVLAVGNFT